MLKAEPVKTLINETYDLLSQSISKIEQKVPAELTAALKENVYRFSGCKTDVQLKEMNSLLRDDKEAIKPFYQFQQDALKINDKYNKTYLNTEYNYATSASIMAAKWAQIEEDGDEYWLQYRTANDGLVRPEHQALDGITLPPSDPFWDEFYPPNDWNCFEKGTKILTNIGWVKIEQIKKGDIVVGGSGNYQLVSGIHINAFNEDIINLFAKGIKISCTPNHRFITKKGWIAADKLKRGNIIIQVGKIGTLDKLINAIHNIVTLLRYIIMTFNVKRKSCTLNTFND